MNKRDVALGLFAGLAGASLLSASAGADSAPGAAEAKAAVLGWLAALASHDPATVAKVLAPEFQIMRSDGTGFDAKTYLANLPKLKGEPEILELAMGATGDVLVVRYKLKLEEKISGKPVQTVAPRLSAFRKADGAWLIAAHANFAQIG